MAEQNEKKSKKGLLIAIIAVAVVAVVGTILALTLGKGSTGDTSVPMSAEEQDIHDQLAAEGDASVEINSDLVTTQSLIINGNKTLTGTGTIKASAGEYAITIAEGATLTLDGPTVDCEDGATNGIYVSPSANYNQQSGSIVNLAGHGVRVLGTSSFAGGTIDNAGSNWVMVDGANAETGTAAGTATFTGGTYSNCVAQGVLSGAGSTVDVTGGTFTSNIDYAFYNGGTMNISGIDLTGNLGLGYVQNNTDATMTVSNVKMLDTKTDYIYNLGNLTLTDVTLGDSVNSAIENNNGTLSVTNLTAGAIGASFLLNKAGTITLENVTVGSTGAYMCHNRNGNVTGKNVKVGAVGGTAYLNDLLDAKQTSGTGTLTLDTFEVGSAKVYGIRNNCDQGSVTLTNGTFGVCDSHGAYFKNGTINVDGVKFLGSAEGRAVVQIGYKTDTTAVATFKNVDITGGARGIMNYSTLTFESGNVYGNVSSGKLKIGAGVKNSGIMTISGGTFYNNQAGSSGGAVYNEGTLTVTGGTFRDNTTKTSGGAIANSKKGTMKMSGGSVYSNTATNYGGGIYNGGELSFAGGTVSSNYATKGGGGIETTGHVSLTGGKIKNNSAGGTGGGFYVGSKGSATLAGVKITGNKSSSTKSAGGVYSLGKCYIKSGTVISGNKGGTYGGGVSNSISSDGSKVGKMYISGGKIIDNTAKTKGGGGVYNRGIMTISGGTITGNHIPSDKNGKNVYNSGTLTISGGKMNDCNAKPYDIYSYKGEVKFEGSPKVGSIYKASQAKVTVSGKIKSSKNIKLFMSSYIVGTKALYGSTKLIKNNKAKFTIKGVLTTSTPKASDKKTKYLNNNGIITRNGVNLNAKEAKLIRDGKVIYTGLLSVAIGNAKDGDTIKVIGNATVTDTLGLTYFTSTKANRGKTKNLTITDDGKAHTITIDTGDMAGFYIASSSGDGDKGTSDSGYYRTYVKVNIKGKGGLTFKGAGDMQSAPFVVSGPATLNVSGKVTFKNFSNVATKSNDDVHSSGKNGGVMSIGKSGVVNITGATFKNNQNETGGGAIYSNGKLTLKNCTFTSNKVNGYTNDEGELRGNGGAIYTTSKGRTTVSKCTFKNNSAVSGGAIYNNGKFNFTSGTVSNNYATKGGGIYNYATMVISGGKVTGNSIAADNNGKNIYNGGTLTISGGKINDCTGKPYDIYSYKGNINIEGSPNVGSIYKATKAKVTISGKIKSSKNIRLYMASYIVGTKAIYGTTDLIKNNKAKFTLKDVMTSGTPEASDKTTKYLNDYGYITQNGVNLKAKEAKLIRDGKTIYTGLLSIAIKEAKDGDTIRIIDDVTVSDTLSLSYFTSTEANRGKTKTVTITGDSKAHTVTVNTGSMAAFYIAASTGDGANGTSDSGYYRSNMKVNIKGAGGLTFVGASSMQSAPIIVSGPSTLNISGKVAFKNFSNTATESNDDVHSSGKNGGVISVGASGAVNITGATFSNNNNKTGGGVIYANGKVALKNCTFTSNKVTGVTDSDGKLSGNGGAIYVTSTGKATVSGCTFTSNSAVNGGAIYVYGGTLSAVGSTFKNNKAVSEDGTAAQAIYVTNKAATTNEKTGEKNDDAVYGSVVLNSITATGSSSGQNDIVIRDKASAKVSGKMIVSNLSVPQTICLGGALTSGSKLHIVIPETYYNPGQLVVTDVDSTKANVAKSYNYITVNDGPLTVDKTGCLTGSLVRAKIGDKEYSSLDKALEDANAAAEGATIVIVRDFTLSQPENTAGRLVTGDVTIDLNGHVITTDSTHKRAIFALGDHDKEILGGTLTIKDSSEEGTGAIIANYASNSGAIVSGNYKGTFNLESGTLTGKTSGNGGIVRLQWSSKFNMTGGTIDGAEAEKGAVVYLTSTTAGSVSITGGEIKNCTTTSSESKDIYVANSLTISGDNTLIGATIYNGMVTNEITGGYFTNKVTPKDGYVCESNSDKPGYNFKVVVDASLKDVASIGETKYKSFDDALEAVKGGETIKLLDDCTQENPASTANNVTANITIDMNDHNLTAVEGHKRSMFMIGADATLTVKNSGEGTSTITNEYGENAGAIFSVNGGTLNLENIELLGKTTGNGGVARAYQGGTINLNGAVTVLAGSSAKQGGAFYIGGTSNGGTLNIESTSANTIEAVTETTGTNPAGIYVTNDASKINISSANAMIKTNIVIASGTNAITAGYYATEVTPATDYKCVEDSSFASSGLNYKVVSDACVAKIGDTEYETIEMALAAALDGETVKLVKDCEFADASTLTIDKAITIDLNGKKLGTAEDDKTITIGADVTIMDSSEDGDGSFELSGTSSIAINADEKLTVTGGKVVVSTISVTGTYAQSAGELNAEIEGTGKTVISGKAKVAGTISSTTTEITGGYFTSTVTPAEGFKCQASTKYEDYGYEVVSNAEIDGKDLEETDPFEETTAP